MKNLFIHQIALAIGVLTSNRGGGVTAHLCGLDVPSDKVPLLGAMWSGAMVRCHCLGAIARCHGRGAIAGCHCEGHGWMPLPDASYQL